jgi:hypothetical protein
VNGPSNALEAVRRRLDGLGQAVDSAPFSLGFRRRLSILDRRIGEAVAAPG